MLRARVRAIRKAKQNPGWWIARLNLSHLTRRPTCSVSFLAVALQEINKLVMQFSSHLAPEIVHPSLLEPRIQQPYNTTTLRLWKRQLESLILFPKPRSLSSPRSLRSLETLFHCLAHCLRILLRYDPPKFVLLSCGHRSWRLDTGLM
jgi:hypothetical protein